MGKSLSINIGLWVFTICLIMGLALDIQPIVMLKRAVIAFAISAVLGYLLRAVIQRYFRIPEGLSSTESKSQEAK